MTSRSLKKTFAAFSLFLLASVLHSQAQRVNMSAREAINLVSSQFGPQSTSWIAEMRAEGGIPQPSDWQLLAYDERAPRLLYRFWAGGGRAGDGGMDEQRYPDDVPVGYFNANQIVVDSVAAFTIAEGEARKARMAFDSCDYLLRSREYSTEPIWRLELKDASRRLVGKLYISANNGEVLRTVWVYRDQRARTDGLPLIIDSFAPTTQSAGPGLSSTGYPAPTPSTGQSGIAAMPPAQVPGAMTGIHSVPLPPAPGMAVNSPQPGAVPPGAVQPYAPVDSSGRVSSGGIPSPPPMAQTPVAPQVPVAPVATAPAPPVSAAPTPANKPAPTKPPIPTSSSSGGNSDRIPPPPIP